MPASRARRRPGPRPLSHGQGQGQETCHASRALWRGVGGLALALVLLLAVPGREASLALLGLRSFQRGGEVLGGGLHIRTPPTLKPERLKIPCRHGQ